MVKLELIHNKKILNSLKELRSNGDLEGFTSLIVHAGYGPQNGEFKEDHVGDEQYYTVALFQEETKAKDFVAKLKANNKLIKFQSFFSTVESL